MSTETSKKFYMVTYEIPVQTGCTLIEAEDASAAAAAFVKKSLTSLFRIAESATGDDPVITEMLEYDTDPTDDPSVDPDAVPVDLEEIKELGYGSVIA